MTADARRTFDAPDIIIACAVALLAQLGLIVALSLPSPEYVNAEISNENAQPIAVAIIPVLKLGTKNPTRVPSEWQRRAPAAKAHGALPSPQAEKTVEAIPKTSVADASVTPSAADASRTAEAPREAGAAMTASSSEGSEQGTATGTEADPLKARAADLYRSQLAAWFAAHFEVRGKIPFDRLKTLHASAQITVTPDRKVGSFLVVKPSGDPTFDAEVRAALERIQTGGAELPPPPPMYPEILGTSVPVGFGCNVKKLCE